MALNKDQQQLIAWYEQGNARVAFRHGLNEQTMQAWLKDQGYGSELASRMLGELKAEIIGYRVSCLDPIAASVWLLLLSDHDKDQSDIAELINTVCFDIAYNIANLADIDGTGLHQVIMTIVDDTNLDHEQIMDWLDTRLADLTERESRLLQLLADQSKKQPRAYYFGLIDTFRALN